SPRELVARINAVLRRAEERPASARIIKEGVLVIDKDAYAVTRQGIPVKLSATEFRLLLYLVERKGRVFNREQLLNAVWSDEAFVEPRTVDVHIRRLRAQIEENPSSPRYIKTLRGAGYFFDGKQ
ncbi:MAG: DNA-binding response regulator, partial [Nitrospirae bacterium CG_4_9_14_3_um_filter_44_28]